MSVTVQFYFIQKLLVKSHNSYIVKTKLELILWIWCMGMYYLRILGSQNKEKNISIETRKKYLRVVTSALSYNVLNQ